MDKTDYHHPEQLARLIDGLEPEVAERVTRAWHTVLDWQTANLKEDRNCPPILPCERSVILKDLGLDADSLVAILLLPLVMDEVVTLKTVGNFYGRPVAHLIDSVMNVARLAEFHNQQENVPGRAEGLRKMLLAMIEDLRVVLIWLAMCVQTVRGLSQCEPEIQQKIARESRDLHAPLANRLGIWQFKWELEDLAFRYLEPAQYKHIARQLDERRSDREQFIQQSIAHINKVLDEENIKASVSGRPKHIYSIWRKMKRKGLSFSEIYDVRAVRVLTDSIRDCYTVLGIIHNLWPHIPSEFDDYIARPKGNNYQSLHTAVHGVGGQVLEVQIRTHDMHHHSEYGVAAHWRYKEGRTADSDFDERIAWLRQVLDTDGSSSSDDDFLDQFRNEVFHDNIYVLSPKGQVIDLPLGSTPLDFAYAVHTEVGHRCRGARVGGKIVPLTTQLKNGDQVEVLTAKQGSPSRDWLNASLGYLKTSRARGRVRAWFRQQDYEQNLADGREILERELKRLGAVDVKLEGLAQKLKCKHADDLFAAIGRGDITVAQIAGALPDPVLPEKPAASTQRRRNQGSDKNRDTVVIDGVGNLMTNIASCCKPAPPDSIIGFITRGSGVTVHRKDCPNVLNLTSGGQDRLIDVDWAANSDNVYPVDIQLDAYDRQGLLRDVTALISNEKINLTSINTHTDTSSAIAHMRLTVEVSDVDRMSHLLSRLSQLPNVFEVKRG